MRVYEKILKDKEKFLMAPILIKAASVCREAEAFIASIEDGNSIVYNAGAFYYRICIKNYEAFDIISDLESRYGVPISWEDTQEVWNFAFEVTKRMFLGEFKLTNDEWNITGRSGGWLEIHLIYTHELERMKTLLHEIESMLRSIIEGEGKVSSEELEEKMIDLKEDIKTLTDRFEFVEKIEQSIPKYLEIFNDIFRAEIAEICYEKANQGKGDCQC